MNIVALWIDGSAENVLTAVCNHEITPQLQSLQGKLTGYSKELSRAQQVEARCSSLEEKCAALEHANAEATARCSQMERAHAAQLQLINDETAPLKQR